MGLEARIWSFWIGFGPRDWDLGLKTGIWVLRLGFKGGTENRSPKGNMWSAIPVALLCMVVNWNERQGSGPEGDEVL